MKEYKNSPLMKRKITILGLCLCGIFITKTYAQEELRLKLTLEDAKRIALNENPTIKIAGQDIELKKVSDKEAWQALLPTANLVGSYTYTLEKQTAVFNGSQVSMGIANAINGGISLNLPLYIPALYKTLSMTKDDIQLAVEKARGSKLDLVNQVTKAYYQLLLAQDSYAVMKKSYEQGVANYKIVEAKYEQGKVSEYEKIRAQVQANSLKPNVISSQNAIDLAKLQLKVLLALDTNYEIDVLESLSEFEDDMFIERLKTDSAALSANTDLRQLNWNEKLLQHSLKIQKTNFLPTLSASFNYYYTSMSDNFRISHYNWFPYSNVVLNLNIPLYKASNFTDLKKIKIQQRQLVDQRQNVIRQLVMQAEAYQNSMDVSTEQLVTTKENKAQAQKGRDISFKRYEVGAGTLLELNDSEVALTQAELAYTQSIYDYLVARADLEKVVGQE